jgi:hypothetical protein
MSAHTAGPLVVEKDPVNDGFWVIQDGLAVEDWEPLAICSADPALSKLPRSAVLANARLYAAAPDMLKALLLNFEHRDNSGQKFLCNCPRLSGMFGDASEADYIEHATACADGRAAIEKARGR